MARERARADLDVYATSICYHEAGHAVAGLYFGRPVEYVQTGANPHCLYGPSGDARSERDLVVSTLAGPVAGAYAERRPVCADPDLIAFHFLIAFHLRKTRRGEAGSCDECYVARLLTALYGEADEAALIQRWRAHEHDPADLFDRPDFRLATSRVARALIEHVHLSAEQVAALVDGAVLRAGDAIFRAAAEAVAETAETTDDAPHREKARLENARVQPS